MDDETSVDVLGYLVRLKRFWVLGLVVLALVSAAGFLWSRQTDTTTVASVNVLVQPGDVTSDAQAVQQQAMLELFLRSLTQTDDNATVLADTARATGLTTQQVAARTSIEWAGNTLLLRVNAKGSTKADAQKLAQAYATALAAHGPSLLPDPGNAFDAHFVVVDSPAPPAPAASSMSSTRKLAAAVVGAVVVALLAMALADGVSAARRRFA